jgi:hypothetical protein
MNDNKSILKEALTDYNEIMEAADANAKKKLAEEFPDKFNNLLKEEINKNKKSVKESYKKLDDAESNNDETESNNESLMEKNVKEAKKVEETAGKDGVFNIKAKKVEKVEEDVHITDTVGKGDPFKEKAKKVQKVDETIGDSKPFGQKTNKPLQTEEFDITELDTDSVGSSLDNAGEDDEVLTMEEIEREISSMEGLGEELSDMSGYPKTHGGEATGQGGDAYSKLLEMKNQLDEILQGMGGNDGVDEGLGNFIKQGAKFVGDTFDPVGQVKRGLAKGGNLDDLFITAFPKLSDPRIKGQFLAKLADVPEETKQQILQQYLANRGGSVTFNNGQLTYIPTSAVKYASATAPVVTGQGGMAANEGLGDFIKKGVKFVKDTVDPVGQIRKGLASGANLTDLFMTAFDVLSDPRKKGQFLLQLKSVPDENKRQILQQWIDAGGKGSLDFKGGQMIFKPVEDVNYQSATAQKLGTPGTGGVAEMHQVGGDTFGTESQINRLHNQGPTDQLIDEENEQLTEEEIDAILGGAPEEGQVDEAMGIAYSAGTITPGKLGDHEGTHGRFRQNQNESKSKIDGLIKENKNLTKKLNEVKKYKNTVGTLLEQYKTALGKYRLQLTEMAIFNTNLAHVNNLLVNEGLALTQDDKIKIINEFKKVDSIANSQKKYKNFLTEMAGSRKTLTESVEDKVTTSIQPSSKQKLEEVVEKTAYADDKHIQKMRKLIEYVEKRGKKIIN